MGSALVVYFVGVLAGFVLTDASFSGRAATALLWPLGALAFAVTMAVLLVAAAVFFPIFGGAVVVAVLLWLFLS